MPVDCPEIIDEELLWEDVSEETVSIHCPLISDNTDLFCEDVSEEIEEASGEFSGCLTNTTEIIVYELSSEFGVKDLTEKIRKLVHKFRKSPLMNDALQKRVFEEFKKELAPLKDCKTRWNSTLTMFDRFYKIRKSIGFTLIDLGGKISFSNT